MKILGIESTCDETAAAVIDGEQILSNAIASQIDVHKQFGGVFPEIAAREHLKAILPAIKLALKEAGCIKVGLSELYVESNLSSGVAKSFESSFPKLQQPPIDAIAIANRPGLIGGLMIGAMTARTLAETLNIPLVAVDHVYAHIYGAEPTKMRFPLLALVVSGGHTTIYLLKSHTEHQILGETRDDAVGEAFDKAAKILGLPYPGGPSIAKAASAEVASLGKSLLPMPKLDNPYEFSFSGLKTAFLRRAQELAGGDFRLPSSEIPERLTSEQKSQLANVFQESAVQILLAALQKAAQEFRPEQIIIAGGVSANQRLRERAAELFGDKLLLPEKSLSTDNAVMIARAALYMGLPPTSPRKLTVQPN
ncbi:MAG: tRNA (adenosine(37)-N6)-threonylcarbamoyltransferase complex transferase subunit TsaD [Candidatus Nomurabacteria bacterium]|jgi:N6-L-threonylcarbamoyladenine synthase|nr:tRNA (adenosine(37)-N6)-threonylcarbamoyltransferase complex transferase subunit TsaD [Candidatus Nomurabacteria bacterium]